MHHSVTHFNCSIPRRAIKNSNTEFSEINLQQTKAQTITNNTINEKSKKGKRQSVLHLAEINMNFNLNTLPTGGRPGSVQF
jgi:hypothetical protein